MPTNFYSGEMYKCTSCDSYQLVVPECENPAGEWGACGMLKKIVEWDDGCDRWWQSGSVDKSDDK